MENQFSQQDKRQEMKKKIGLGLEPTIANLCEGIYHWTTAVHCHSTTQGPCTDREMKIFSKIERYFGFPHDSNY